MRHIATGLTLPSLSLRIIEFLLHYKQSRTLYKGIYCALFGLNFPWGAFSSSWGLQGLFTSTSNEAGYLCTMCGETTKYSLHTEWTTEPYAHSVTSSVVAEPDGSKPQMVGRDSAPIQYIYLYVIAPSPSWSPNWSISKKFVLRQYEFCMRQINN
jgi:hypothetical protein